MFDSPSTANLIQLRKWVLNLILLARLASTELAITCVKKVENELSTYLGAGPCGVVTADSVRISSPRKSIMLIV